MSSEESSSKKRNKYLVPLLIGGGVALVVYSLYLRSQNNKIHASQSTYSNYSGTESLATEWNDGINNSTPPRMRINVEADEVLEKRRDNVTTPSMRNVPKQSGFQKHGSRGKMDISMSSIKSSDTDAYAQELTPAIPKTMRFTRRLSVPKMDAPKRFLGESSYRETVIFLLAFACYRLFPNEQLVVENTFKFGTSRRSYLCRFVGTEFKLSQNDMQNVENEMKKLSEMQLELESKFVSYSTSLQMLQSTNQLFSAKLVQSLNRPTYRMVGCDLDDENSFYILQYRSTLNNTKYCNRFNLHLSENTYNKFVCLFPSNEDEFDFDDDGDDDSKSASKSMSDMEEKELWTQPEAVSQLFGQGLKMSKMLDCKCVADINLMIQSGRFKELMLIAEAYHNRQIVKIANDIGTKSKKLKMILISGPSSSGKTTFASKLSVQLRLLGMIPTVLEVDMFFRDRADPVHPRDAKGNLNFEVIEALHIKEFNQAIDKLIKGEKIKIPNFDFTVGSRRGYKKGDIELDRKRGVLIMEGIFCLNPQLFDNKIISNIDDISYKIFICPISPFYALDNYHFISEQVMRICRRISRDHFHRGKGADQTVFKWGQLKEGEDINIFPFVKHANAVFNSALIYELSVLKVYSYPLLQTVTPKSQQYKDAQNLLSFLDCFLTMPDSSVPSDSLLMEFIGKSIFEEI